MFDVFIPSSKIKGHKEEIDDYLVPIQADVVVVGMSIDTYGRIGAKFKFTKEQDAVLFKLTWG